MHSAFFIFFGETCLCTLPDVSQHELLLKKFYHSQLPDQTLTYVDNRLANRCTVLDCNGYLMGPIEDQQGLEQGGCSSSDFYKVYGQKQLQDNILHEIAVNYFSATTI